MKNSDIIIIVFALSILVAIVFVINLAPKQQAINKTNLTQTQNPIDPTAPDLQGISGYINTNNQSIKLSDYFGKKVILIDFWTYTCINCIRTLPYVTSWDQKYRDDGLLIIGVHTPEFDFEKNYTNVLNAVNQFGIKYPVVQDNNYKTWNAYNNRYWPAKYLIDKNGNVVYTHFGEGNYEETENKIQELLKDLNSSMKSGDSRSVSTSSVDFYQIGTPEIYFGYNFRRSYLGNEPAIMQADQVYNFTINKQAQMEANKPYFEGVWKNNADNFELVSETGRIILYYKAKNVNIVAGSDGFSKLISSADKQVQTELNASSSTLYNVVSGTNYNSKILELNISGKGFKIYTFTFG